MHLPRNLLDRPVQETSRLIALAQLDEANAARKRMRRGDAEGLHDFRVNLRRLRSTLKAYAGEMKPAIPGRVHEALTRLARSTNRARDYEVHRQWALALKGELEPRQRAGVEWLVDEMDRAHRRQVSRMEKAITAAWPALRRELRRRLRRYKLNVRVDQVASSHTAAPAIGRGIRRLAGKLEDQLLRARAEPVPGIIHRARIRAKRLRYYLEPIQDQVEESLELVAKLKSLQDLLGGVTDGHQFIAELDRVRARAERRRRKGKLDVDPRPGLLELRRRLAVRNRELLAQLDQQWSEEATERFFTRTMELADSLAAGERDHREIERKYLLRSIPPAARVAPAVEIEQGWLPGNRIAERVRRVRGGDAEQRFRTIKAGFGLSRLEIEEELPSNLFEHLWPLTEGRRVTKRRHRVNDRGLVWEIDEFADRDLVLAEVELPDEDTAVDPPEWLRPYVVREVTGEDEYVNLNLAR